MSHLQGKDTSYVSSKCGLETLSSSKIYRWSDNRLASRAAIGAVGVFLTGSILSACGGGSSTATPSWASSLGTGVTVMSPSASTGSGLPETVAATEVNDVNSGHLAAICSIIPPSEYAKCNKVLSAAGPSASTGQSFKNFTAGYTVIDGNKALVGYTGTFCSTKASPKCQTNTNPAAIFSSGKSFTVLFNDALNSTNTSGSSYSLAPLIKIGSKWYMDVSV